MKNKPDIDNILNYKFFRWLCQNKQNFMYECHINLGFPQKDIISIYKGHKTLEFDRIKKICEHYSIPTRMFFEEKNLNIKDNEMAKKKFFKEKELEPVELDQPIPEVETVPSYIEKVPEKIVVPVKNSDWELKLMPMFDKNTFEANIGLFRAMKRKLNEGQDSKSKEEVLNIIGNKFNVKSDNPWAVKVTEILLS